MATKIKIDVREGYDPKLALSLTSIDLSNDHMLRAQQLESASTLGSLYANGSAGLSHPLMVDRVYEALRQQKLQAIASLGHPGLAGLMAPPTPYLSNGIGASSLLAQSPTSGALSSSSSTANEEEEEKVQQDDADKKSGDVFEPFPQKLYRMIQEASENGMDDVISFFPHGRAFVIHKPRAFVANIIPKYFTTTRMSSFQRQLNLYGFKRITEGPDMGGYYHTDFVKGHDELLRKIKRKKGGVKKETGMFGLDPRMAQPKDMVQNLLLREQAAILQMSREISRQRQEQARALALMQLKQAS